MGEFLDEIIIRVSVHEFWTGTDIRTLPVPPTPVAGEWSTDGAPRTAVPYGGGSPPHVMKDCRLIDITRDLCSGWQCAFKEQK